MGRNRPDLRRLFRSLEDLHVNFYEHQMEASDVQDSISEAGVYIREMAQLRREEPPSRQDHLSSTEMADQECRLRRLTARWS